MSERDSNLRFAVLALVRGLIDERQFISACRSWATHRQGTLAESLVEWGWLSNVERRSLELLVEREQTSVNSTMTVGGHDSLTRSIDIDSLDLGEAPLTMRERITLRNLHSSGGIGEVWLAYDEVLGREVALKWLKRAQAEHLDNRMRFKREAQITGQLEHPGVVPVYDFNTTDDGTRFYYTMRFLRGRTLSDVVSEFHSTRGDDGLVSGPFLQLLNHFISICNTMAYAHSRGVVHRDLKGDNVIVGKFGEVVVIDWGLAKRVGGDESDLAARGGSIDHGGSASAPGLPVVATMQGERLGTPAYMAPEQALGSIDQIDERTDVYGLTAILFDILTGRPPFQGTDVTAVMNAVVHEQPPHPSELVRGVPPELERICLKGLAKDRRQRWQCVADLAEAVQGWVTALAERKRTEQEREHFFDLSLDLLAIVDRAGRVRQSNAAWETQLGWSERNRVDVELLEFIAPEHRELAQTKFDELWAGGGVVEFEVHVLRADGTRRWFDLRARTLPDEAAIYVVGRDVTERHQSEQQFIGLLESAPDATCVIDDAGVLVLVNKQLEQMFGHPRERLIGRPLEVLVPEHLRGRHVEHVRRYFMNPSARPMGSGLALTGQRQDGVIIPIEVSLSPVQTETRLLVSCALRIRRDP